jgi:hypothetical protein
MSSYRHTGPITGFMKKGARRAGGGGEKGELATMIPSPT